jgi:hypothetical protein
VVEDLSSPGVYRYRVRCIGTHAPSGTVLGECVATCSSNEEKYKWRGCSKKEYDKTVDDRRRMAWKKKDGSFVETPQVRAEADDVENTILKMAEKRAHVGMTILVTAASDIFAQDIEDLPEHLRSEDVEVTSKETMQKPQTKAPETVDKETGEVTKPAAESPPIKAGQVKFITAKLAANGVDLQIVLDKHKVDALEKLTVAQGNEVLNSLKGA